MKDPSRGEDRCEDYGERDKEERSRTNDQFIDINGRKYKKVFDGTQGVYVWEITDI